MPTPLMVSRSLKMNSLKSSVENLRFRASSCCSSAAHSVSMTCRQFRQQQLPRRSSFCSARGPCPGTGATSDTNSASESSNKSGSGSMLSPSDSSNKSGSDSFVLGNDSISPISGSDSSLPGESGSSSTLQRKSGPTQMVDGHRTLHPELS